MHAHGCVADRAAPGTAGVGGCRGLQDGFCSARQPPQVLEEQGSSQRPIVQPGTFPNCHGMPQWVLVPGFLLQLGGGSLQTLPVPCEEGEVII